MTKVKTIFVCSSCHEEFPKWMGQCSSCKAWNTLSEQATSTNSKILTKTFISTNAIKHLGAFQNIKNTRKSSGLKSFNQLLGEGYVSKSVILLGGEPGIGKSTLLLMLANSFKGKTLYVTGEESLEQIFDRAERLGITNKNIHFLQENNLSNIIAAIKKVKPELVFIDSIQTIRNEDNNSFSGSISQVKEATQVFLEISKEQNFICLLTGHITKDGQIAGPKLLEHAVDVVLYFENYDKENYRFIRVFKNRFGNTGEIAPFEMTAKGLIEIQDNQQLIALDETGGIGSILFPQIEGSRGLLLEIQVLVTPTGFTNGRRIGQNIEVSKIHLIAAILEKYLGYKLSQCDIYVRIRGGTKLHDAASDLALCLAMASSYTEKRTPPLLCVAGELSLTGVIRPPMQLEKRLQSIRTFPIQKFIVGGATQKVQNPTPINLTYIENLNKLVQENLLPS